MQLIFSNLVFALMLLSSGSAFLAAQSYPNQRANSHVVHNLGTLGGTQSSAYGINNLGWVTGAANLEGDQTEHAVVWHNGLIVDLGTLLPRRASVRR